MLQRNSLRPLLKGRRLLSPTLSAPLSSTRDIIKPKVSWLDLQGSNLSALERLCLEEALLRHDPLQRSWGIVGTHSPTNHKHLKLEDTSIEQLIEGKHRNDNCIIIMGIGGRPEKLLNVNKVRNDGVTVIKRFTGGGTVVVDHCSLWTTFIGRVSHFPHVQPYPRNIMEWSADEVFSPSFKMIKEYSSTSATATPSSSSSTESLIRQNEDIPDFRLRENDYVLGEQKMGGNAQSLVQDAWLHHTSFLWDYQNEHMEYLTLPEKRPEYRGNRDHDDFLVKLKNVYGENNLSINSFFEYVKVASATRFDLEEVTLKDAMELVVDKELGGMQNWFDGKCRTRILNI